MEANFTLKLNAMVKKSIISLAMIGVVALASASSGGGEKKKSGKATAGINLLKSTPGFSLKAGPMNSGKLSLRNNLTANNTVLTYRKGNTIYILPSAAKTPRVAMNGKNNLNLLNLKVPLRK